ncbi:MAG TPA: hypothetical protein DCE41_05210 [Cytophagales bacterium]|nr:hypothetical protein [Cytophagales bacterium]HAA17567.1 hypothetical protein [Cytophagales bacterium]HAP63444.1 hypothetical protein [Cytophagales bacterium]
MYYCYLDALITKHWATPQQEFFLTVALDPKWNPNGPHLVYVGWSNVAQLEIVNQYFKTHQPSANNSLPGWQLQNISWKNPQYFMISLKGIGTIGFGCDRYKERPVTSHPVGS